VYIVVFNLLAALFSFYIYPSIQLALVKVDPSFPTDKPETQYTRFESWSYGSRSFVTTAMTSSLGKGEKEY
jgi:hypothetical protein